MLFPRICVCWRDGESGTGGVLRIDHGSETWVDRAAEKNTAVMFGLKKKYRNLGGDWESG